jgi:Domain of unknown function (DUF4351)
MPSQLHELLLMLFRNRSKLLAQSLYDSSKVMVPNFSEARIDSADLTDIQPAEYRADLVITLLAQDGSPVMSFIVEAQLAQDERKRFVWPAYAANLRARLECPVCVLVVTLDESVARWAAQPIELGGESIFVPLVLGPAQIAKVTDVDEACALPELAVLSVMAHGQSADIQTSVKIARAALHACTRVEEDRRKLYKDIVYAWLSEAAQQEVKTVDLTPEEIESDYAVGFLALGRKRGRVEGQQEGRAELVKRLLTRKFGPLTSEVDAQIGSATSEELDGIGERILSATTVEQALTG